MADFCNQCAQDHGFPIGDLARLTKEEDWAKGMSVVVICEGCGITQVDPEGYCIGGCEPHQTTAAHYSPRSLS